MSSKGLLRYVRACAICESELPLGSSARRRGERCTRQVSLGTMQAAIVCAIGSSWIDRLS